MSELEVLEVFFQLTELTAVAILSDDTGSDTLTLSLTSLPPLLLDIVVSAAYPSHAPPVVSICSESSWLTPQLASRCEVLLKDMWRPTECVLYDWVEFIRGGEILTSLDLFLPSGDIEIRHPVPRHLGSLLTAYDDSARSAIFSRASYACTICLETIKGSKCIQLSCTHIFCRSCLFEYWSLSIIEGNVEKLGCPDPECVKMGRESGEAEIARVVSEEEVERWRWLREKILVERDPSLVHCPMAFCQTPVPRPSECDSDIGVNRLRICPACSFSFCGFCKRTWHGAVQACPISQAESVVVEYLALADDSKERWRMELQFGKTILWKLVARYQEEQLNKKWLADSTMACPGCALNIEKSLGCNHMTCTRCKAHFCYRCGDKLNPSDPYTHFSTPWHPFFLKAV
ncbi:RWD-domain-containing protein [Mycena crocata]|nr:RWD-domain-containing protein [Mycena crocata]